MSGKSSTFENDWLKLVFNAVAIANLADNAAASPLTGLWVAAHTADPGAAGTQGTNETNYTGYTRFATSRTTGANGWSVSGNVASPVSLQSFPQATSTSTGTLTHYSVGVTSASSAGKILYYGPITPNINFGQNVTPQMTTGSSISEV